MTDEFDRPRRHFKWSEVKWAKATGASMDLPNAAWSAARRSIAGGERPAFRVEVTEAADGIRFAVADHPWISGRVDSMDDVDEVARFWIAGWLRVPDDAFDVRQ